MEVERAVEPISGLLRLGEDELSFVGWVALAGALERILDSPDGLEPSPAKPAP